MYPTVIARERSDRGNPYSGSGAMQEASFAEGMAQRRKAAAASICRSVSRPYRFVLL